MAHIVIGILNGVSRAYVNENTNLQMVSSGALLVMKVKLTNISWKVKIEKSDKLPLGGLAIWRSFSHFLPSYTTIKSKQHVSPCLGLVLALPSTKIRIWIYQMLQSSLSFLVVLHPSFSTFTFTSQISYVSCAKHSLNQTASLHWPKTLFCTFEVYIFYH